MTTTERCDMTELLVDQCGCPQHRGGHTVDEETAALREQLLGTGRWIAARFPGRCCDCRTPFGVGTAIRQDGEAWRAECCS